MSSCRDGVDNFNRELTLDSFSELSDSILSLNSEKIRDKIIELSSRDGMALSADIHTRKYYSDNNHFIWINRLGACGRADTLLLIIRNAGVYGFDTDKLRVSQIENDLERVRALDFSDSGNGINTVMARLEYNLTRAYFRYFSGLRFGLINPDHLYNNFEENKEDTVNVSFIQLSDLGVERPSSSFFNTAVHKAFSDSIGEFLSEVQPRNDLYKRLLGRLDADGLSAEERIRTLCNIERCRWRLKVLSGQAEADKYVEVNIPSYSLRAVDKTADEVLTMKIGCGTLRHKTPLLTSRITRMDINPQWIVPKSISKGYVGRYEFMHKMGMFVVDKQQGKLPPEEASLEKIMNNEQYIVQAGGPKNSLGRIIFRFDNAFSVFLHDTSSPWVFNRTQRAVSHGCVRVERPYDLAVFLLGDKDDELCDKLKYSMTVEIVNDNDSLRKVKIDRKRLVNSISVKPQVPLFITYFTIYYDNAGQLADFADIYGYDEVLAEKLKPFVR